MSYCVYHTTYFGDVLPKNYVGSSSVKRVLNGYRGSVRSKKWKKIWENELNQNPELFNTEIVSYHETRKDALSAELEFQKKFDCIRSHEWINEGYAKPNGYAGRDVSGQNNPRYGKGEEVKVWVKNNTDIVSERNRKAALTQWRNDRDKKIMSMVGKKKTRKKLSEKEFKELQQKKALQAKLKCATIVEYKGVTYVGWKELQQKTGVTKHLYKKYYLNGIDPCLRMGKNGPVPKH